MIRAAVVAALVTLVVATAAAQERGEANADLRVFVQPASSDALVVITPSVSGKVHAKPWLLFDVNWSADIVTGATPRTYGSPDVVSAATRFSEVRNVIGGGAAATAGPATFRAGYGYGTESDYRSHLIRGGLTLDLAQHNTILTVDYSHSFDSICDLNQPGVALTLRQPLDSSRGCFAGVAALTEERLDLDDLEVGVVQSLTAHLLGGLSGTWQHADGFQSSPYRRVRLDDGFMQAQESHPRLRDRGAVTARVRYALPSLRATLGGNLRLYRDTWGVQAITGEVSWEQPLKLSAPAWRYVARARGYVQSSASFYRDVGWADSYERAGPVGRYFTADQELAPIADLLLGARFVHDSRFSPDKRRWRMFTEVEWSLGADYVKIFALSPEPPNAARTRGFASALVLALSATGRF